MSKIHYQAVPDYANSEEKRSFVASTHLSKRQFDLIVPDKDGNWIGLAENSWEELVPVADKKSKSAKRTVQERAIFKLFSLGVVTARDEWVYDFDPVELKRKVRHLIAHYNDDLDKFKEISASATFADDLDYSIKWTRAIKRDLRLGKRHYYDDDLVRSAIYRPFTSCKIYFSNELNEVVYQQRDIFGWNYDNHSIVFDVSGKPFSVIAVDVLPDYHVLGDGTNLPLYRYTKDGTRIDNITDWGLKQFQARYESPSPLAGEGPAKPGMRGRRPKARTAELAGADPSSGASRHLLPQKEKGRKISKDDIFHYVYGVLHDPVYREKYAINLKREFPRLPFYPDFWVWAEWGQRLMDLHIGYETVEPWPLTRHDQPPGEADPLPKLKANKDNGTIILDTVTTLGGIPAACWDYRLGNRSGLEWILDQYKEKKPKDKTIAAKFNTYRFKDYKEKVIGLLARVTRVSVETMAIIDAMKTAKRG